MTAAALALQELALQETNTTGRRAEPVCDGAPRAVRTRRGLVLFDGEGRCVGMVDAPEQDIAFGPGGHTVLVKRQA